MNNSDEPSNINKENIHNLLSEIEDMNKFQSKIQHNIHEILNLCDLIDSINCDLNNFKYLFTLINKEEIFKRHFEKSLVVLETFRKWGQLSEIANMDLQDSSERIFNVLKILAPFFRFSDIFGAEFPDLHPQRPLGAMFGPKHVFEKS